MNEARSKVEALVEYIRNLTTAQADKLVQQLPVLEALAHENA